MPARNYIRKILLVALIFLFLLCACSSAVKYVLVTDVSDVNFADADRFYLCLLPQDAKRVSGMLKLRTEAEVKKYEQLRTETGDPLEQVLYDLISRDYASAQAALDRNNAVPSYLQLLLRADLAYETSDKKISEVLLGRMYQDAYEHQILI